MADTQVADATDDHDIDAPVEMADKPREATPYERKLRNEAAAYRRKATEIEKTTQAAIAQIKADAETTIATNNSRNRERLMRAELKATAMKAGLHDLDTLKLFDLSKAEMSEDGEITNAEEMIEGWKKAKPHFFAGAVSTSSTASTPRQAPTQERNAREMSDDELKSFERTHGIKTR